MIMRYPNWKTYKEEEEVETYSNLYMKTNSTFEGDKGISRFRSPSSQQDHQNSNIATGNVEGNGGESSFLQWGHRKRSRCSRGIIKLADDETYSSATTITAAGVTVTAAAAAKIQRRSSVQLSPNANLMPPPLPSTNGKLQPATNNHPSPLSTMISFGSSMNDNWRNLQSGGGGENRSISGKSRAVKRTTTTGPFVDKKNPPPPPCSSSSIISAAAAKEEKKINQEVVSVSTPHQQQQQQGGCSSSGLINRGGGKLAAEVTVAGGGGGKVIEWPRIYLPLSRKEKEEDFIQFKGTKLPHRPKKRPKAIDRVIQYCYPGMWLPDLSKARYEVREKKSSKKQKRRGLKGMESMESDSE